MLRVVNSILVKDVSLKIDDYVPFVFRSYDTQVSVPYYWRIGDFKTSLIEIGLNPDNGAIGTIKVPFFGEMSRVSFGWNPESSKVTDGLPICDIQAWSKAEQYANRFIDEVNSFKTIIGLDFVSFHLMPERKTVQIYILGQLCIGVDELGSVCKVGFNRLSGEDITRVSLRTKS
jgi:hypothetical protein